MVSVCPSRASGGRQGRPDRERVGYSVVAPGCPVEKKAADRRELDTYGRGSGTVLAHV